MAGAEQLQFYASTILQERIHRTKLFPRDLFDEYAWEIMLGIFAADKATRDHDLYVEVGCRPAVGDRWIDYLREKGQVIRTGLGGKMIDLTDEARSAISSYLNESLKRAAAIGAK